MVRAFQGYQHGFSKLLNQGPLFMHKTQLQVFFSGGGKRVGHHNSCRKFDRSKGSQWGVRSWIFLFHTIGLRPRVNAHAESGGNRVFSKTYLPVSALVRASEPSECDRMGRNKSMSSVRLPVVRFERWKQGMMDWSPQGTIVPISWESHDVTIMLLSRLPL